jgi:branched-chain amino acid transport system permease protein
MQRLIMTADLLDVPPIFDRSLTIGPIYIKVELLLGFIITILCTVGLQWMIRTTYLGKAIRATVQDGEAAMLMGIPVPRIFLITFAVGSALVGLAACVMMPLFSVFPTVGLNFCSSPLSSLCWAAWAASKARCSVAFASAWCNR